MPDVNINFKGATLIIPGAYYGDNVSANLPANQLSTPPLIFIGAGYGKKPKTAFNFSTAQDLKNALRGGPCAEFVPFLTNPSNELNGAQLITYINPAVNTQSSLAIAATALGSGEGGADDTETATTLLSADYGTPSNLLQISIDNGMTESILTPASESWLGMTVTLYDGYNKTQKVGEKLGLPFKIAYTGSEDGVTYSVSGDANQDAVSLTLTSPVSGETMTFPLTTGTYDTIKKLVEAINGTGYYSAQSYSDTNGLLASSALDPLSNVSLPAPIDGVYSYVNVTAVMGDLLYWLSDFASAFIGEAELSGDKVSGEYAYVPDTIPLTFFSGATNGVASLQDYADAFNVALTVPGFVVFADSNDAGVMALGVEHATTASTIVEHKYRRFITGSTADVTTDDDAKFAARSFNSITTTYVYPGYYRISTLTGLETLYGGLYAAAAIAGMWCGNDVNIASTNKSLIGTGVEKKLTQAEINDLQKAGVMCLYVSDVTAVPTIVSDLTSWQVDNNPENVFNQQVACRQALAYSILAAMQPYTGKTMGGAVSLGKMKNTMKTVLNNLTYTGDGSSGLIATWDAASLKLTYDGTIQTTAVTVDVVLVGQNRFITIYVSIQPLSVTV